MVLVVVVIVALSVVFTRTAAAAAAAAAAQNSFQEAEIRKTVGPSTVSRLRWMQGVTMPGVILKPGLGPFATMVPEALTQSQERARGLVRFPAALQSRCGGIRGLAIVHVPSHVERWQKLAPRLTAWGIQAPEQYIWPAVTPDHAIVPVLHKLLHSLAARQPHATSRLSALQAACFASHWLLLTRLGQQVVAGDLKDEDWVLVLENDVACIDASVQDSQVLDVMGTITRQLPRDMDLFWWGTYRHFPLPAVSEEFKAAMAPIMRAAPVPIALGAWTGLVAVMYRGRFLRSLLQDGLQLHWRYLPIDHAVWASVIGRGSHAAACSRAGPKPPMRGLLNQALDVPSTVRVPPARQ